MADLQTILRDPDFRGAGRETQREILSANDADFRGSQKATQDEILNTVSYDPTSDPKNPWRYLPSPRVVAPMVLGTAGAIAGGIVGNAPGALLGSGIGSALGEGANQMIAPSKRPASDIFTEGLLGMLGEGIGRVAAPVARSVWGAGKALVEGRGGDLLPFLKARMLGAQPAEDAPAVLNAFRELGMEDALKVTDVSKPGLPSTLEAGVTQMFTGRGPIYAATEKASQKITAAAQDYFMARVGPAGAAAPTATGLKARAAAERSLEVSTATENRMFDDVRKLAAAEPAPSTTVRRLGTERAYVTGPGRDQLRVDPTSSRALAERLLGAEQGALAGQRSGPLRGSLRDLLDRTKPPTPDDAARTASWDQARQWASRFGRQVEQGELISKTPVAEAKAMYAAIMEDMERAVAATGRADVQAAFDAARDFGTRRRAVFIDSAVSRIMKADPEDITKAIDAAGGPTAVRRVKEGLIGVPGAVMPDPRNAEAWNYVRRHIFEGVFEGATKPARGFANEVLSPTDLKRRLARIGDESLNELLDPTQRRMLDNVVLVTEAIQRGQRASAFPMTSGTGSAVSVSGFIAGTGATAGAAVGGMVGMPWLGGAGGLLAAIFAPPMLAKALTNPRTAGLIASPGFAKIATDMRLGGKLSDESVKTLSRLGALMFGESEPAEATR